MSRTNVTHDLFELGTFSSPLIDFATRDRDETIYFVESSPSLLDVRVDVYLDVYASSKRQDVCLTDVGR